MKKALVIIPTYNEKDNIDSIIASVLKYADIHILIVDDGSPDGTAGLVRKLMASEDRVFLIERTSKLGLGSAYVTGFKWGLQRNYEFYIEMDADGSHDPEALPFFLKEMEKGFGLVIGSRYLNRAISVVGWDFRRLMLSKFGNFYASWVLGLRLTDLTSGFRCFSRDALMAIDLGKVHSNGYAFQIEMAYRVAAAGYRTGEIPIIFYERTSGSSKMSKKIVREAIFLPWRLRLGQTFAAGNKIFGLTYHIRTIVGFLTVLAGTVGSLRLGWWLGTEGDIIELIHNFKMGLPDWAWLVMKVGLSAVSAVLAIGLILTLAIAIFAGRGRNREE
jgi:dolichol-phosphate mannosyltransferase